MRVILRTNILKLLNSLSGFLFAVLLIGKFSTKTAGFVAIIEVGALTGTGAGELTIFFGPYFYGDTGKRQRQ